MPLIISEDRQGEELRKAAQKNDIKAIKRLVGQGLNIQSNPHSHRVLKSAIRGGRKEVTELLLRYGLDLNGKDEAGDTPLHLAALFGHSAVVNMMLQKGAKVNIGDSNGNTPLMNACRRGHIDVVKPLVGAKASLVATNSAGETAIHKAAGAGQATTIRALYMVVWRHMHKMKQIDPTAPARRTMGYFKTLDLNARDHAHCTPMHAAALRGKVAAIRALAALGAEIEPRDAEGSTPLHWSCYYGHAATAQALLEHGSNPNARDNFGWTPLHKAVYWNREELVALLLKNRGNMYAKDSQGRSSFDLAKAKERRVILVMFEDFRNFVKSAKKQREKAKRFKLRSTAYKRSLTPGRSKTPAAMTPRDAHDRLPPLPRDEALVTMKSRASVRSRASSVASRGSSVDDFDTYGGGHFSRASYATSYRGGAMSRGSMLSRLSIISNLTEEEDFDLYGDDIQASHRTPVLMKIA